MGKIGALLIMIICWAVLTPQIEALNADNDQRRAQALRLYQEGLFQETGTGDLTLAFKIYSELAIDYNDIPDIAAVAYYHMGILSDKSGKQDQAKDYFKLVLKNYPKQVHVIKRIKLKLAQMELDHKSSRNKIKVQKKKSKSSQSEGLPKKVSSKQADSKINSINEKKVAIKRWGLGLHTTGLHGRYIIGKKDKSAIEINLNNQDEKWTIGGRLLFISCFTLSDQLAFNFYPGLAIYQDLDQSNKATYNSGGFVGSEVLLLHTWGLGLDVGYYYGQTEDERITTSIKAHAYATYYF